MLMYVLLFITHLCNDKNNGEDEKDDGGLYSSSSQFPVCLFVVNVTESRCFKYFS